MATKTKTTSYKLHESDLYLVQTCVLPDAAAKPQKPDPIHHILVLDCSGSMTASHPKMRKALSDKLYTLVGEDDVVSIVWFSGKGEHGLVVERAPVPTLREVQKLQKIFERWIRPVGWTGFKGPLIDVHTLLSTPVVRADGRAERASLFFLTDGMENQWPRAEVFEAVDAIKPLLSGATVVEYGYYADRAMLSKMAERLGGALVFAEDFLAYEPAVESAIRAGCVTGASIEIDAPGAVRDVVFCLHAATERVVTFEAVYGVAKISDSLLEASGVGGAFYLTKTPPAGTEVVAPGWPMPSAMTSALYAALGVFAVRLEPDVIYPILKDLGDVSFIEDYGSLFGKQAYSDFLTAATDAAFEPALRASKGIDRSAVPRDDAYTVLDLLTLLSLDERSRVLLDHPSFRYARISRERVDATEGEHLTFRATRRDDGYGVKNLTWNEDRANVSILVQREGVVDLTGRLPFSGVVPNEFPTYVWRNYAIVKDGIRNVSRLAVKVPSATLDAMRAGGCQLEVIGVEGDMVTVVVTLDRMPILNRSQVSRASAGKLFDLCAGLTELRARNKVLKSFVTEERRSETWDERYGKEAADWLRMQGLTEWGGYQPPKTTQVEAKDFYLGKLLEVKIKGWSSLPSVKDVGSGKSKNGPGLFMKSILDEVEQKKAALGKGFDAYVAAEQKAVQGKVTALTREAAKIKFAVIVSGSGFLEFPDVAAEMKLTTQLGGKPVEATAVMSEEKIFL